MVGVVIPGIILDWIYIQILVQVNVHHSLLFSLSLSYSINA